MGWIITASVIAAVVILISLPVRINIKYSEQLAIRLWVLCFPYTAMDTSRPEKRKKQKKERAAKKPKRTKAKPEAEKPKKLNIRAVLRLARILIKKLIRWLGRYLHVNIKRLDITVGTDDAAKTALLYAGVCEAAGALMLTLRQAAHLKIGRLHSEPDFIGGQIKAAADIRIWFSPLRALQLAFGAALAAVKNWPLQAEETQTQTK